MNESTAAMTESTTVLLSCVSRWLGAPINAGQVSATLHVTVMQYTCSMTRWMVPEVQPTEHTARASYFDWRDNAVSRSVPLSRRSTRQRRTREDTTHTGCKQLSALNRLYEN